MPGSPLPDDLGTASTSAVLVRALSGQMVIGSGPATHRPEPVLGQFRLAGLPLAEARKAVQIRRSTRPPVVVRIDPQTFTVTVDQAGSYRFRYAPSRGLEVTRTPDNAAGSVALPRGSRRVTVTQTPTGFVVRID